MSTFQDLESKYQKQKKMGKYQVKLLVPISLWKVSRYSLGFAQGKETVYQTSRLCI